MGPGEITAMTSGSTMLGSVTPMVWNGTGLEAT